VEQKSDGTKVNSYEGYHNHGPDDAPEVPSTYEPQAKRIKRETKASPHSQIDTTVSTTTSSAYTRLYQKSPLWTSFLFCLKQNVTA
jgi:hypothetical protein